MSLYILGNCKEQFGGAGKFGYHYFRVQNGRVKGAENNKLEERLMIFETICRVFVGFLHE